MWAARQAAHIGSLCPFLTPLMAHQTYLNSRAQALIHNDLLM
jgi:hypothetical protein